jgi:hypothetical protein
MPWADPRMSPLSMMAPLIVLPAMLMPVLALIVPLFETFPEASVLSKTMMPAVFAVIAPLLVMPPEKLAMMATSMPLRAPMVPLFEMPPLKVEPFAVTIPAVSAVIVPPLLMPPEKFETPVV